MIEILSQYLEPGMIGICKEMPWKPEKKLGKIFFINHPDLQYVPGPLFPGQDGWHVLAGLTGKSQLLFPAGTLVPVLCRNKNGLIQLASYRDRALSLSNFRVVYDLNFDWYSVEPSWIVARSLA